MVGGRGPLPGSLTWLLAAFSSSLAVGPVHRAAHNTEARALGTNDERRTKGRGRAGERSHGLYNLILEVTSYHFCPILFLTSELVSPSHTPGKGLLVQEHDWQEAGMSETIFGAAYHIQVNGYWRVRLFPLVTALYE